MCISTGKPTKELTKKAVNNNKHNEQQQPCQGHKVCVLLNNEAKSKEQKQEEEWFSVFYWSRECKGCKD